jgi:hypothetical protein
MGKCAMWGPSGLPADLDLPEEMERPEEGVVVLGVPIGSEAFTTAAVRAKLEIHVQHLDTLSQLQDSQVALPCLRGATSSGRHIQPVRWRHSRQR